MDKVAQRLVDFSAPHMHLFHLGMACLIGGLLGAAVLFLPLRVALGICVAPLLMLLFVKRPEAGILGILVGSSTIFNESQMPAIPGFYLTDIALLALFGLATVRWIFERDFHLVTTPLAWPLLAFFGLTAVSTIVAVVLGQVAQDEAVTEMRYMVYYLIFFAAINLIRTERQLRLLLRGIIVLATLVVIAMLIQYAFGQSIQLIGGRVEALRTSGAVYSQITRITNFSGEAIVLLAFISGAAKLTIMPFRAGRVSYLVLWLLFGVGVVLTFNRNFWLGSGLSMLLLAAVIRKQERQRYLMGGAVICSALLIVIGVASSVPDSRFSTLLWASTERLTSIFSSETFENDTTSTLLWREFEYQHAVPQIPQNLLLGLGMGATYRPPLLGIDHAGFDGRGYIHNAHLWLMLKSGGIAYLCFIWLSVLFLWRSFVHWRRLADPWERATVLGFALTYLAVLLGSIVNPMLTQWYWIPLIGLMMATNELIIQRALSLSTLVQKMNKG